MRMIYSKLFSDFDLDNPPATTEANSFKLKLASAIPVTYCYPRKLIRKQLGVVLVKVLFPFRSLVSQAISNIVNLLVPFPVWQARLRGHLLEIRRMCCWPVRWIRDRKSV